MQETSVVSLVALRSRGTRLATGRARFQHGGFPTMGAKILEFDQAAREKIRAGVMKLARAVKVTFGPRGRNAVIDKGWGSPNITKDGVTVAEEIDLKDPFENMGAQLV